MSESKAVVERIDQFDKVKSLTLLQLTADLVTIEAELRANYGEIDPEVEELLALVKALREGKADKIFIMLKEVIPIHREACKLQDKKLQKLAEKLESLIEEAIRLSGEKSIEGLAWRARLQSNSQPSLVIENAAAIPERFLERVVTLNHRFPKGDADWEAYWRDLDEQLRGCENYEISIDDEVNKAAVKDALIRGEAVPGARLEQGEHLRIEKGKNKPTKTPGRHLKIVGGK